MKKKMGFYRQGDVFLVPADLPRGSKKLRRTKKRIVLAEGEVTGHAHAVLDRDAELYETESADRFLRVLAQGGVDLVHEEHATITLPKDDYRILIQREYQPEGIRRVSD